MSRSGSAASLSRRSVDSFQPSPSLQPWGGGEGNADQLFKFDISVERGTLKENHPKLLHQGNSENHDAMMDTDSHKKKKKKEKKDKKEKREKKDKKRSKVENDIIETTTRHDVDLVGNNRSSVSEFVDIDFENDCEDILVEAPATNWQIEVTPPKSYERSSTNSFKSKSMGDHRLPITLVIV